jgi:hypothetical protein
MRWIAVAALAFFLPFSSLAEGGESSREVLDQHCGYERNYCHFIERSHGRIKFTLVAIGFNSSGLHELCVKPPRQPKECRPQSARKQKGGGYVSQVDFKRNFSHREPGLYVVGWHFKGRLVGGTLHFHKSAG